ncbi:aquaporin [Chloroflexota bacterium]
MLLEAVITFALVFVVFATAMDSRGLGHLAPLVIGMTILVGHLVAIPFTGTSMNPARSFGPALVANVWMDHWIFWLGPLIGGGLAALIYEYIFLRRKE